MPSSTRRDRVASTDGVTARSGSTAASAAQLLLRSVGVWRRPVPRAADWLRGQVLTGPRRGGCGVVWPGRAAPCVLAPTPGGYRLQLQRVWFGDVDGRGLAVANKRPIGELAWALLQGQRLDEGFVLTSLSSTTAVLFKEVPVGASGAAGDGVRRAASEPCTHVASALRSLSPLPTTLALQYVVRLDPARGAVTTEIWLEASADPALGDVQAATLEHLATEVSFRVHLRTRILSREPVARSY